MVCRYTYDDWGKCVNVENLSGYIVGNFNPFRYRGYYFDQESGLYYVGSRYYDPEIGRWISADETGNLGINGNVQSYNLYAYCLNNPINRYDDSGTFSLPIAAKVAIGAVATVAAIGLTIASGGTVLPVLAGVASSTTISGALGYISGGIEGMKEGLADGFMWGGLFALGGSTASYVQYKNHTTGGPNTVGKLGEQMAGIDPAAKRPIHVNGRTRIPDELTSTTLKEVKNAKYVSNTQQLRDFAQFADSKGLNRILCVRPNTRIAHTVIDAGWKITYLW